MQDHHSSESRKTTYLRRLESHSWGYQIPRIEGKIPSKSLPSNIA